MYGKNVSFALDRFTTFGDLLKYLRRRVGLTQRELSIAVSYSDTQISRLEQNERMPDLATLTARFLPALQIEDQPAVAERLLELAAAMRREDAPAVGLAPYKGLQYFEETDTEFFFGREALTLLLLNRLEERLKSHPRFLAIVGASGSGKSSLVRAGLLPALRWRSDSSGWPVVLVTPSVHPLEMLAKSIIQESHQNLSLRKFVDELIQDPKTLRNSLDHIAKTNDSPHVLLIVDQFEELFTLCRSEVEQTSFVENLITASTTPGLAAVIIVMRADFYAHCARFNSLRQVISQHQEYIGPMTIEELRCAIEEPARRGHWDFEAGLVELLLHDVGADAGHTPEPGALPLLSHALLATWQRRRGHTLTLSGYTASGGVRGAIAETAESVYYDQLEPDQRDIARQIFLRLTELGGETSTADTRRRVNYSELISKPGDRETVQEVLLTLADARLITTSEDTAEVSHEALIREWPTLRGWLEEDREGLRLHRRLTETAHDWDAMDRDPSILYRGVRLAQAIEWVTSHPEAVNILEHEFLDASQTLVEKENNERETQRQKEIDAAHRLAETERARAEEQSQSNDRLKRRAIYLILALAALGLFAVTALVFWQRAVQANHFANSRQLAAAAVNNIQIDPELSTLLSLQALTEADTLEARNALHQAVPELHQSMNIDAHPGGVPDVAYSPDGKLVATMGADGLVKLWDAYTGKQMRALDVGTGEIGGNVAFNPQGDILAAGWVTQVVLWDVYSGEILAQFFSQSVGTSTGYNLGIGQLSFSPDGNYLAAANMDGVSKVWDIHSQKVFIVLGSDGMQPVKAIAYSPDGQWIATGSDEGIVIVWDATNGAIIGSLELGGIIHSVSFSPTGSHLAAASEDGRVKVWDAKSDWEALSLPRLSGLYDIVFLADGRFATAGQDGTVRVWDAASGQQMLLLAGPTSTVISIAGSPDGKQIASGAYDGSLRIWEASPSRELLTIPAHAEIVWNVAYSPDSKRIASCSVDGLVKLWDAETGALLLTLYPADDQPVGYTGLAYSPDGNQLAVGSVDGRILIWDLNNRRLIANWNAHTNMVVGLVFSADGSRLASASWDASTKIWDVTKGTEIASFTGHAKNAMITGIAFHPDGKSIFTGADDKVVYQWDAETGNQLGIFSGEGKDIFGVAISQDSSMLAAGNQDGDIYLWSVDTGKKLRTFSGHAGLVLRLAFNHDGSQIASAGFDRLAKVWDVETGNELFSLYGNTANVFGVSFSPDHKQLATAGADGTVRTYTLQIDHLIPIAISRLTRSMTPGECQKYLYASSCP